MQAKILRNGESKEETLAGVFKASVQAYRDKVMETLGYRGDVVKKPRKWYSRSNREHMKIDIVSPRVLMEITEKW